LEDEWRLAWELLNLKRILRAELKKQKTTFNNKEKQGTAEPKRVGKIFK